MNEPWDWDESDLLGLIRDKVSESPVLEYKAPESLRNTDGNKKEISKDVSAFANSAGGTIAYGIDEDNQLPLNLRGVNPATTPREWIEQVINSQIQQRIDGIRINQIPLAASHPGHVAYVVTIPQSTRAPHMASDKRFYKRFNFQSVPMEEYEVRDVARREEAPDLWLEFDLATDLNLNGVDLKFNEGVAYSLPVEVAGQIVNRAPAVAEYALLLLAIDSRLQVQQVGEFTQRTHTGRLQIDGVEVVTIQFHHNWALPAKMPIWEGVRFSLGQRPIMLGFPREPGAFYVGWEVYSPDMSARSGSFTLVSDGAKVVLR